MHPLESAAFSRRTQIADVAARPGQQAKRHLPLTLHRLQNIFIFHHFAAAEQLEISETHWLAGVGFRLPDAEPGDIERWKKDKGQDRRVAKPPMIA